MEFHNNKFDNCTFTENNNFGNISAELKNIKESITDPIAIEHINEAETAIRNKDESKLLKALKSLVKHGGSFIENVLASTTATFLTEYLKTKGLL